MNNIVNNDEDHAGLDISDPAFVVFILAKIMSLPTVVMIFVNHVAAVICLSLYGALIFTSVGLCIKKIFFSKNDK